MGMSASTRNVECVWKLCGLQASEALVMERIAWSCCCLFKLAKSRSCCWHIGLVLAASKLEHIATLL